MKNHVRMKRLYQFLHLMENYNEYFREEEIEFNISNWFKGELRHGCGTAACALGAACLYPPFKRAGLKLRIEKEWGVPCPTFKGSVELNAGEIFFGITYEEAADLFFGSRYRTGWAGTRPHHVATKIRKLIKKYSKETL